MAGKNPYHPVLERRKYMEYAISGGKGMPKPKDKKGKGKGKKGKDQKRRDQK